MGAEIEESLARLKFGVSRDLDAAAELMLVQLADQRVPRGTYRVANLVYQDSDYSSAFGAYAAETIASSLGRSYRGSGGAAGVVRGSYWIDGDTVILRLLVQTTAGELLGSSTLSIPRSSVPPAVEITPRNAAQALADRFTIAEGAVADGGISVEVWTHMGRNEDRLVFTEGETVSFFFRVNQPCFLQITYLLASGDKVLLDESFYIGIDKVNMAVRYLIEFTVVPPFGVERLIVTAYEDAPPKPNVTVGRISGQDYQVFGTVEAVYAATRGLVPNSKTDPNRTARVGETSLTLTTAAKIQ